MYADGVVVKRKELPDFGPAAHRAAALAAANRAAALAAANGATDVAQHHSISATTTSTTTAPGTT